MSLTLNITWEWRLSDPIRIHIRFSPEGVPHPAKSLISGELFLEGEVTAKAVLLANLISQNEQRPGPISIGDRVIESVINKIEGLQREKDYVAVTLQIQYPPDPRTGGFPGRRWPLDQLSPTAQGLLEEIDRYALEEAYRQVYLKFGGGIVDADRWKAQKSVVFISYRSGRDGRAEELFRALGDYEDATVFLPRINKVDMQAGNWIGQLEHFIKEAPNFVPILTPDYLSGPVASKEIDLALRLNFGHSDTRRLVPVLIEGNVVDYKNTFLGGYHIYEAQGESFTREQIRDIANLLLGISRNPYDRGWR